MRPDRGGSGAGQRTGFTLIELLVVISIIATLAGLIIPAVNLVLAQARQARCANNLKQVVLGMLVYAGEHDGAYPVRYTDTAGADRGKAGGSPLAAPAGTDATATATASMEMLAAYTAGDIGRQLFRCPAAPALQFAHEANPALVGGAAATATWLSAQESAFAYDWSVPGKAIAMRVVLSDRPAVGASPHRRTFNAVFADGHVATLAVTAAAPIGTATVATDANAATISALNPDAGSTPADNIFDGNGDGSMTVGGIGSTSRAWVR